MRDLRFDEAPQAGFHPNHSKIRTLQIRSLHEEGGGHSLTGSFSQFCSKVTHPGKHSMLSQNYRNTKIRDTQPVSQVARLLFRFALLGQLRSPQTPVSSDLWGCKNSLAGNRHPPSLPKCNCWPFFALPRL